MSDADDALTEEVSVERLVIVGQQPASDVVEPRCAPQASAMCSPPSSPSWIFRAWIHPLKLPQ
jgi:hypothetical protein